MAGARDLGTILLTGATGLIGGAVLHHALVSGDGHTWRCLVRAPDAEAGRRRVAARLARFTNAGSAQALARRVEIVAGDVTRADFDDDPALDDVTHVLHLAADTSWKADRRVHRTNHDGTLALARRAARMRELRRFLHVGTAMICGGDSAPVVMERDYPQAAARHIVSYTASKARAETSLRDTLPDLPLVVARPSIVVGHTALGARPSSSILWALRAADRLRLLPCDPEVAADIVPADWTAAALHGLLFKPALVHDLYHLSAGEAGGSRWSALARAFEAADPAGSPRVMRSCDFTREHDLVKARFAACFGLDGAVKLAMLRAFHAYARFWTLGVAFDNARLLAEGFPAPPSLPDYLAVCEATSGDVVEQFADDLDMFARPAAVHHARARARRPAVLAPASIHLRHAATA